MAPDQLDRYRQAVADEMAGIDLEQVIREVTRHAIEVHGHDSLKTAPKSYPSDHSRLSLLRHKGLSAWKEWTVARWLGTVTAKQRVTDFLHATQPLNEWFTTHVGPSTVPERRR